MANVKMLIYGHMPGNAELKLISVVKPGCAGHKKTAEHCFFAAFFVSFLADKKRKRYETKYNDE
ncbi:hypothetical protein [Taibaiella koreensis]|uniref:hypothetical protein n=1 Tax=Taibaiella koreensis TaxID=1268548 RepID=UPI0013C35AE1|nr:hypothetical protein [Taibaiella koreensis]